MGEKGEKLKDNRRLETTQVRSDQGPDQVAALGNHLGTCQLFVSSSVLSPSLEMKLVVLATRVDAFGLLRTVTSFSLEFHLLLALILDVGVVFA